MTTEPGTRRSIERIAVLGLGNVGGLIADMLIERVAVTDAPPFAPIETSPGPAEMQKFAELLGVARAPIVLLGGSRWSQDACDRLANFVEKYALPVCTTFRRGHLFDQTHPCYAGDLGIGPNPKLLERIKSSDLVIVIGGRLGELPSQHYTLFDIPRPQLPFVHVHPGAEELGRVYSPQLAINATPTAFTAALETLKFTRAPAGDAKAAHQRLIAMMAAAHRQRLAVLLVFALHGTVQKGGVAWHGRTAILIEKPNEPGVSPDPLLNGGQKKRGHQRA